MNGTVAPALAARWSADGHRFVPWNRQVVPVDDPSAIRRFIADERPDWFFHVAMGSADWAEAAAQVCAEFGVRFLLTSSASVFSDSQPGPHGVDTVPDARDEYGRYKIECEHRVRAACPEAIIARIGWQIGQAPGSNNMIDYLHRTADSDGRIQASTRWYPACSFLEDTAESLCRLTHGYPSGTHHLDGNPGLSLYEIVIQLNRLQGRGWTIVQTADPAKNNLMIDERITIIPITQRFAVA